MLQFGGPHTLNEERSARFLDQPLSALKKCFSSGERASGRKKSVVNSVYLKERHGAYCFSTLSCESYLRAALFGLNHGNRVVFFERVPRTLI